MEYPSQFYLLYEAYVHVSSRRRWPYYTFLYRKTAVKLPPFKVEDVRLKNECLNCYESL